jgi:hypothetical protein
LIEEVNVDSNDTIKLPKFFTLMRSRTSHDTSEVTKGSSSPDDEGGDDNTTRTEVWCQSPGVHMTI